MPWPSTPAAPLLAETFSQAASSVAGAHLIHQTVPTTSFDAVNQRRHHADCPDRSFHPRPVAGFSTLCSPCGHCRSSLCFFPVHSTSTFLPTFPRHGFAFRAFHGYRRSSTMRALTPAAPRQRDRSLHSIHSPSGHPIPTHVVRPNVTPITSCARSAPRGTRLRQA